MDDYEKRREELKSKMRVLIKERKDKEAVFDAKYTPPRYDEIYYKGMQWLDSL